VHVRRVRPVLLRGHLRFGVTGFAVTGFAVAVAVVSLMSGSPLVRHGPPIAFTGLSVLRTALMSAHAGRLRRRDHAVPGIHRASVESIAVKPAGLAVTPVATEAAVAALMLTVHVPVGASGVTSAGLPVCQRLAALTARTEPAGFLPW